MRYRSMHHNHLVPHSPKDPSLITATTFMSGNAYSSRDDPIFRMSRSPPTLPQERRYDQTFRLDSGADYDAYLTHPLHAYSGSAREFLDSQPLDPPLRGRSRSRNSYEDLSRSYLDPSADKDRDRIRGYPGTRYGNVEYTSSAPLRATADRNEPFGSTQYDPFRESVYDAKSYYQKGPIRDEYVTSPFKRAEDNYHHGYDGLAPLKTKWTTEFHRGGAESPPRHIRKQSPGLYVGQPKQTREWHKDSYDRAFAVESGLRRSQATREAIGRDYVGYDTFEGARGHRDRLSQMDKEIDMWAKRSSRHKAAYEEV